FDVNGERGLVAQHSIRGRGGFAYGMAKTANEWGQPSLALALPPAVRDCPTRYRRPTTGEEAVAAETSQSTYARDGLFADIAATNRHSLRRAYATGPGASQKKHRTQAITWRAAPARE